MIESQSNNNEPRAALPKGGLLSARDILATLFPVKSSRPSLRFIYKLAEKGDLPCHRLGKRIFFDPKKVREAISKG